MGPDGHVDITVRGVMEDLSHARSGTLERLGSQMSVANSAFKVAR